jgi:hypothetical protein
MTTTDFVWAVAESLVASALFAGGATIWKRITASNRSEKEPNQYTSPKHNESVSFSRPLDDNERRFANRRKIQSTVFGFFFYFFSFMALYFSIAMPPLFQAMLSKQPILLSQARLIGDYLPDVIIGKSTLQVSFLVMAMVLYLPLLKLSEAILAVLRPLIETIIEVTPKRTAAYTLLIQYLLCIPVATASVWCFSQKTLEQSFMSVVAALFLAFIIGAASEKRRS